MRALAIIALLLLACAEDVATPHLDIEWTCIAIAECDGRRYTIDTREPICADDLEDAHELMMLGVDEAFTDATCAYKVHKMACERGGRCLASY